MSNNEIVLILKTEFVNYCKVNDTFTIDNHKGIYTGENKFLLFEKPDVLDSKGMIKYVSPTIYNPFKSLEKYVTKKGLNLNVVVNQLVFEYELLDIDDYVGYKILDTYILHEHEKKLLDDFLKKCEDSLPETLNKIFKNKNENSTDRI